MLGLTSIAAGQNSRNKTIQERHENIKKMIHASQNKARSRFDGLNDNDKQLILSIEAQIDRAKTSLVKCPDCQRNMIIVHINQIDVDYCHFCQSCWLDQGELKTISKLIKDIPSDHLPDRPAKHDCPICQEKMTELVFKRPYNLLVDRCKSCRGVYLEHGELERVLQLR